MRYERGSFRVQMDICNNRQTKLLQWVQFLIISIIIMHILLVVISSEFRGVILSWVNECTFLNISEEVPKTEGRILLLLFMSDSLQPHGLYSPWNSPGKNTRVSNLSLFQGIFPTKDQTQVSHIACGFFTSWATREAQEYWSG